MQITKLPLISVSSFYSNLLIHLYPQMHKPNVDVEKGAPIEMLAHEKIVQTSSHNCEMITI
jgi:hypothetical protein